MAKAFDYKMRLVIMKTMSNCNGCTFALAKSATSPVLGYRFAVTVSGPGMSPRTQSWNASEFGGKTVALENIPSGSDRMFTGTLLLGAAKTHEGSYTVDIGDGHTDYFNGVLMNETFTGKTRVHDLPHSASQKADPISRRRRLGDPDVSLIARKKAHLTSTLRPFRIQRIA